MSYTVFSQNVREVKVNYLKQEVNGYEADYNISKSDLSKIMENYFDKNIKGKRLKNKDFYQYKGVNWNKISLEKADVYYKVDGSKKTSKLIILVSKGYDNYVHSANDAEISNQIKSFFSEIQPEIDRYFLAQRIEEQKKIIKDLEKKQKDYLSEQQKLQKKLDEVNAELGKSQSLLSELESQK